MKFIVGAVALVCGGKIFAPGAEIAESDFLDSTTFENAKNKNLIVATDSAETSNVRSDVENTTETSNVRSDVENTTETSNVRSDVENTTETSKKSGKKKE